LEKVERGAKGEQKFMSVRSMTGHGRGTASLDGIKVEIELSAVNRKQLDISIALPRMLAGLGPRMDEVIGKNLSRGRVTGEVAVQFAAALRQRGARVDVDLAEAYLKGLRKAAKRLKLRDDFTGSALLTLPDVVRYEQPARETEKVWPAVEMALNQALEHLMKMREREGGALGRDLEKRLVRIESCMERVRAEAPRVASKYRERLMARLGAAEIPVDGADERLLREVALFADRSDITEEITRLESHIQQARTLMKSREPVGRSLDFLVQEMFREANTIGSKANDAGIARDVVAIKTELDRIREQVQNIE
jgi:uncharacterized protein (TIGR00255 family)